ncbi:MAG: substrate-binding domain-containing protein [Planctomycetota bacterium]|nr:substrate-binding domain-containing protein [Planctomycetota bacterium]
MTPRNRAFTDRSTLALLAVLLGAAALGYWLVRGSLPETHVSSDRPLIFFCAAGMMPPVELAKKAYEEEFGRQVQIQYGGSGTLLSNLQVAGKVDLYLAADSSYIDIARERGLVAESIPLAYLRPVIAVRKGNPRNILGIDDLLRSDVAFALANPDAAAVGRVTRSVLEKSGRWEAIRERTRVLKPTVMDLANDLKLGAVDAAVIWDATANQYDEIDIVSVPEFHAVEREITVGIATASEDPRGALHFARYLGAPEKGLRYFREKGYRPAEGDSWADVPELVLYSGGLNRVAIEKTLREFEEREGVEVLTTYNGCGILVASMKGGARPDAYFACDLSFIPPVQDLFLDPLDVSETDMVILVQKGNPKNIRSLEDLARPDLRVGVAHPEASALGKLTLHLLKEANLHDRVKTRVQSGTADYLVNQFQTKSLDAVVVYAANVSQIREKCDVVRIDHPKAHAVQPYVVGRQSKYRHLMTRLLAAIRSETSRLRFQSAGFRWLGETPHE